MTSHPAEKSPRHLRASDIRGVVQLAAQATVGVSRIAEGVHQSVWSTLGAPGGPQNGRTFSAPEGGPLTLTEVES